MKGKHKLRHEILEYPNKLVFDAINEKLELINPDSVNSPTQLPHLGTYSEEEIEWQKKDNDNLLLSGESA